MLTATFATPDGPQVLQGSYIDARTEDYPFLMNSVSIAAKVPEPSIIALFAAGLIGIGFARRSKA